MTSRSTSFSAQSSHRPSLPDRRNSRRLSNLSNSELGRHGAAAGEHELTEEIEEIKRYEDFTTIDWVQDAAREQLRRRARKKEVAGSFERDGRLGWRQTFRDSYEAGQAWIVVSSPSGCQMSSSDTARQRSTSMRISAAGVLKKAGALQSLRGED